MMKTIEPIHRFRMQKRPYGSFSSVDRPEAVIVFFLVLAVLTAYWAVRSHDFVNYDDGAYVYENPIVRKGLSREGLSWAFSTTETGNRHPLTWISHMLDCSLFGPDPRAAHTTNLMLHIINTLLLFGLLRSLTGDLWRSAVVAAFFGVHPINVESVAWISQRKNIVSTLFWFLSLFAYGRYVCRPNIARYAIVVCLFVLGLSAKPMLITLPLTLLLLDIWPLGRVRFPSTGRLKEKFSLPSRPILEKVPLLLFSGAAGLLTLFAQQREGAVRSLDAIPLGIRAANAVVSYMKYLAKLIWPGDYAVLYPFPAHISTGMVLAAIMVLTAISYMSLVGLRRYPYATVGWLWYLGTLFPVIGLIQVGAQAMADRYAYVPAVGIFIMLVWGVSDLTARWRHRTVPLIASVALVLSVLMGVTLEQVNIWKNSITLFSHALDVTTANHTAHNNLGLALMDAGRIDEAVSHFEAVLRLKPRYKKAVNNIGVALAKQKKWAEAIPYYEEALKIDPDYAHALFNLGSAWLMMDRLDLAIRYLSKASALSTKDPLVYNNLGIAYFRMGKAETAVYLLKEALRLAPDYADAHNNLGIALTSLGRPAEAVFHLRRALHIDAEHPDAVENLDRAVKVRSRLEKEIASRERAAASNPDDAGLQLALGDLHKRAGNLQVATAAYQRAVSIRPDWVPALEGLGVLLAMQGRYGDALTRFRQILSVEPDNVEACYKIAGLYARQHRTRKAIQWLTHAVEKGFTDRHRLQHDRNMDAIRGSSLYRNFVSGGAL